MSGLATGFMDPAVDSHRVLTYGLISLGLHLVFLMGLILWPGFGGEREFVGPIYTVDLVGPLGPPPPPAAGPTKSPAPSAVEAEAKPSQAVKVKAPPPAELIPLGKEKAEAKEKLEPMVKLGTPKESSKTKKINPEKEIDKALARIEERLSEQRKSQAAENEAQEAAERHLAQALERTRQRVAAGAYGSGGGSAKGNNRYALYYTQIWTRIRSNWTLPEEWQEGELEAVLVITVQPSGEITNVRFEKRSGHPRFDQSALWAVERSNPLPPLPPGLSGSDQEIGIRFRPEG